jgi:polyphosphate kinase
VKIDLLVRTNCSIRAGVPGLSENIRVRSIVSRFLEHSRIYMFGNDGKPEYWIGSADLMHRNLDRRVEALVRVTDPNARAQLADLLDLATADNTACWELQPDGTWIQRTEGADGTPLLDYQAELMRMYTGRGE